MPKPRLYLICVLALGGQHAAYAEDAGARAAATPTRSQPRLPSAQMAAERPWVSLTPAERDLADIVSEALAAARITLEAQVTGRVSDAGALLALRSELRAARAAEAAQQAVAQAVRDRLQRLRRLAAAGEIAATREQAELEISYQRELGARAERQMRVATLAARMHATWGSALARAVEEDAPALATLLQGEAQLLEFGVGVDDDKPPAVVFVSADDRRVHAHPAEVVGPAVAAYGRAGGASYFALAAGAELRTGMPLTVWIPQSATPQSGVLVPFTAVVWQGGAQWYYVEVASGRFERRRLPDAVAQADGLFVADAIEAGTAVVVRGAQALLAEEFDRQIPEEDDD